MKYLVRRNLQTEGRRTKNWEMIGCVCHLIYYQPSLRESSPNSFPRTMFTMMIMMILWRGLCQTINCYGRAQMGHYLPQSPKVRLYLSKRGQWKRSGGLTEVVWTSTLSKFLDFTCIWRKRYKTQCEITGNVPTWNRSTVKMILRKWYHQMWYLTCLKQLPFYTWEDCFCFLIITMLITITTFCLLTTSPQIGYFLQTIFLSFHLSFVDVGNGLGLAFFHFEPRLFLSFEELYVWQTLPGAFHSKELPACYNLEMHLLEANTSQGSRSLLLVLSSL